MRNSKRHSKTRLRDALGKMLLSGQVRQVESFVLFILAIFGIARLHVVQVLILRSHDGARDNIDRSNLTMKLCFA
jgi:hypothetical protein